MVECCICNARVGSSSPPSGNIKGDVNMKYNLLGNSGLKVSSCDNVSPKIQQSLLHWSYMVNEKDFITWKKQNSV